MDSTSITKKTTSQGADRIPGWRIPLAATGLFAAACVLYYLSRINYLLFHGLVELSSVAVAVTTFSIGWHARHISRNNSFTLLAVAYLAVGGLDLFHALSYKGMGVFPGVSADLPTQFWIAARSLQACAYLASGWLLVRNRNTGALGWAGGFLAAGILLALAIWPMKIFPACLTQEGLTPFKIGAEYAISAVLAVSGWLYWRSRSFLDRAAIPLLLTSIALAILSELSFTLYLDVYGLANCLGHLFKVGSVFFVYRALVLGALRNPYQSLFRDLTLSHQALDKELDQRRQTEQQLRIANRELDTFVRTVAHDLRSPLTVFISGTELLRRQLRGKIPESYLDMLQSIEEKGWEMARLLEDLLQLARIGRISQPAELVVTARVVNRAIADLREQIATRGAHVTHENLPELQAHPTLIYQLFANLIGNAVRYAGGPESPILVGGLRTGRKIRFFVRDRGPGIPIEEREKLGEIFFRGENAREHPGNGIGLTIVQKIARHYQGHFWMEDTPGGGATFWVELQEPAGETDPDSAIGQMSDRRTG
jgi:signal transduction histidine kinase